MNSHWRIDEPLPASARRIQPEGASAQRAGSGRAVLAQVEQVLGEGAEPDATFFVDCWTLGIATASENFLRRQGLLDPPAQEMPGWNDSYSPIRQQEAFSEASWTVGNPWAELSSNANPRLLVDPEPEDSRLEEEDEIVGPLTLESARRLLNVTRMSTREQIRAAYRRMATRYHPDRLSRSAAREQKRASDRMALINEAYRLLCTPSAP